MLTSSASKDIFQQFEDLSLQIKTAPSEKASLLRESYEELAPYLDQLRPLLIKAQVEGEEAQESGPIGYVPHFMEEMKLFQEAGVSFSEEESFIIFKSLTKLA